MCPKTSREWWTDWLSTCKLMFWVAYFEVSSVSDTLISPTRPLACPTALDLRNCKRSGIKFHENRVINKLCTIYAVNTELKQQRKNADNDDNQFEHQSINQSSCKVAARSQCLFVFPLALPTIPCCSSLANAHDSALVSPPIVSHFVSFHFARVSPPPCLLLLCVSHMTMACHTTIETALLPTLTHCSPPTRDYPPQLWTQLTPNWPT